MKLTPILLKLTKINYSYRVYARHMYRL